MKKKTIYGTKVKNRLVEMGMTQTELSQMVGIKTPYLTYILTGERGGWKHRQKINEILWGNQKLESAI
ncbi:MAG: helix-turn-helix transcriptional regulator [Eubacteriales bacterium]|nr:helix-turn-helix transcriptional regulator [Eubacteriales bacterium]